MIPADLVSDIPHSVAQAAYSGVSFTPERRASQEREGYAAQLTDSRANAYVAQHGASSWEVDALPPNVLDALIREHIEGHLDMVAMDRVKKQEEKDKAALLLAAKNIMKRRNR